MKTVDLETDMDGAESISSTAIPAEVDKTSPPQPKLRIGIVLPKRIFKRRQYREVISRTLSQVLQNEHCLTKSQAKSIFLCILHSSISTGSKNYTFENLAHNITLQFTIKGSKHDYTHIVYVVSLEFF